MSRAVAAAGMGVLAVWLGLASAGSAMADLTAQSAVRFVEAGAAANVNGHAPPNDFDDFQSSNLGGFGGGAAAGVVASDGLDRAESTASASQRSMVQMKSVEALGVTHATTLVTTVSGGGANGDGATELIYDFTLDAATDYEVRALVEVFGAVSDASVELVFNGTTPIFAIGEAANYAQTMIAQTGSLQPGNYRLSAEADTIQSQVGPTGMSPSTAGAEFEFGFFLDVCAPGEIVNGRFEIVDDATNQLFRWTQANLESFQVIEVDDDFRVVFESGAPADLTQAICTPASPFYVEFDYRFLDADGVLNVLLEGVGIAELTAPPVLETSLQHARVLVNNPLLARLVGAPLTFAFAGPSAGLQLELDDVSITPAFAADFDRDGDVDGDDLADWTTAFGASAEADADGDGDSDGNDFLAWQRQVGSGAEPAPTPVPEPTPSALALTTLAAFGLLASRIHRNRFSTSSGAAA